MRGIHSRMVFKTVFADMFHQLLETGYFHNGAAAKSIQRVVDKVTVPRIGADHAMAIIRRDACVAERTRWSTTCYRSIGIFRAECRRKNLGVRHLDVREKAFGPIPAMKKNTLVWVVPVVVIPIDQSARFA